MVKEADVRLLVDDLCIERGYLWCGYNDEVSRGSSFGANVMMMDLEGVVPV
ncbi:hypothetical protein ACLOJK_025405 [Asimina triloba]